MAIWCPQWSIRASGASPGLRVAVLRSGRVAVASAPAAAEGVRLGQRRRQAESLCPGLVVLADDPGRDARCFETVVAAVARFCPLVEVTRPGLCSLPARGPSRYFGGEEELAAVVARAVDEASPGGPEGGPPCRVGVADGPVVAAVAARRRALVAAGPTATAAFLSPLAIAEVLAGLETMDAAAEPTELAQLADLLGRLGIRTMGELAGLPAPQVLARFGWRGAAIHRLAHGQDDRALDARRPPEDLTVAAELDPPVDRVDMAAFAGKRLADQLHTELDRRGLRCRRVRIEAETEHGEVRSRSWRHDGSFNAAMLAERVRWQLEGWLTEPATGSGDGRPTAGVSRLALVPEEVVPDEGSQQRFWGGVAEADLQAGRALARVQALLGPESVLTAVAGGGRGPLDRVRLVPWGDERDPSRPADPPWPGRVPSPLPAVVLVRPAPAELVDEEGRVLTVGGRGLPGGAPRRLSVAGGPAEEVMAWSAPWPCHERWWDPASERRRARMQVLTDAGRAVLLMVEKGRWVVEAAYE